MLNKLKDIIIKRKYLLIVLITAVFLIYFYSKFIFWDVSAYLAQAKYYLGMIKYHEPLRPPLLPLILIPFVWISNKLALAFFIIFTMGITIWVIEKYSNEFGFNKSVFTLLLLNFATVSLGFIAGPDFLALLFLMLFSYYLIYSNFGGLFLSLAILLRYNFVLLTPLIILPLIIERNKNGLKKSIYNFIFFCIPLILWFIYNKIKYGNFFTSILESYALNYTFRINVFNLSKTLSLNSIFINLNYIFIFFIVALIILYLKRKNITFNKSKSSIILNSLIIGIMGLYTHLKIPIIDSRFLLPITFPIILISAIGISKIKRDSILKNLKIILIILFTLSLISTGVFYYSTMYNKSLVNEELQELKTYDIDFVSNYWVYLDSIGYNTLFMPYNINFIKNDCLDKNCGIILFNKINDPHYILELKEHIIQNYSDKYIIKKMINTTLILPKNNDNYGNLDFDLVFIKNKNCYYHNVCYEYCDVLNSNISQTICDYLG
jgi:hypothetical protein